MRLTVAIFLCLVVAVCCQTQHKNGNPTGEIGQPAFDEIVVESTLTVRGKSGSRSGKSLLTNNQPNERPQEVREKSRTINGTTIVLKRERRNLPQGFGGAGSRNFGGFPVGPFGNNFPSSSSSSAQAASNAFNSNTPFGNFGASASQSASQSQSFGPHGFQGSAGQSASQSYILPNGNKIDVSFSNSFSFNPNGGPAGANSHSITITSPDGKVRKLIG